MASYKIPSAAEVRADLARLDRPQIIELERLSDVPFRTLWKIRSGETQNPGIDTVRKFVDHIRAAMRVRH
jgi:predicted transcriptional regulator